MNENLWFMHLTVVGRIGSARQVHGMWVRENLCLIQSALPFEISFEKCVRLSHQKKEEEKIKFKLWSQFEVVHDRSSSQFCHEIDLRDSLAVDSPEPGRVAVWVGKNKWRGRGWIIGLAGRPGGSFQYTSGGKNARPMCQWPGIERRYFRDEKSIAGKRSFWIKLIFKKTNRLI